MFSIPKEILAEFFDFLPIGIIVSSKEGEVLFINRAAKIILKLKEESNFSELRNRINLKNIIHSDRKFILVDGKEKIIKKFLIKEEKREYFVIVTEDSYSKSEKEVLQNEFIAKIAHDIRTQVAAIKGSVDNVIDGVVGLVTSKQRKFLSIASDSADRLSRISEDLLYLSKIESGTMDIQKETINLPVVIESSIDAMRVLSATKGIKIHYNIPENLPNVLFDRNKLERVIINLIDNAIKYTPIDGHIYISAKEEKDYITLSISDNGIGISQEQVPLLFTKFRYSNSADKGVGLGLLIVKEILDVHKEKIWVKSEERKGTTFTFTIKKDK